MFCVLVGMAVLKNLASQSSVQRYFSSTVRYIWHVTYLVPDAFDLRGIWYVVHLGLLHLI